MKKITAITILLCSFLYTTAQYKNDNVLYKTVFPQELCNELKNHPDRLLLDVRSSGEYEDTSSAVRYNLGHLKGAKNIDVQELSKRISEISAYKNKPVFVYCSHSQRSRRASTMLADSGFTKVFNINGGVTSIRQFPDNACLQQLLETKVAYKVIPPTTLCKKMAKNANDIFILDVRSDSAFNHISKDAKVNSYGYFKGSTHIAYADLEKNIDKLPMDKEIILVDMYSDDAARAAKLLTQKNFTKVSVLLEGIDRYLLTDKKNLACKPDDYISPVKFSTITSPELNVFTRLSRPYIFLDVREQNEYDNNSPDLYKNNVGKLKDEVHMPLTMLNDQLPLLERYKEQTVIVFAFGSNKEVFSAANILSQNGFKNVVVLMGGIFNVRWTAANIKGNKDLLRLVTDLPEGEK